jgi:hypothetical protein
MSIPKSGQAYDLTPPEPPEWISAQWNPIQNSILLKWKTTQSVTCVVKRAQTTTGQHFTISENLKPLYQDETENSWIYEWQNNGVFSEQSFSYQVKAINDIGLTSESLKLGVQS